jgi:hypothetical protein
MAAVLLLAAGCKKSKNSDDEQLQTSVVKGPLYFHLHTYIDDITEVDGYNIVYTRDDGRKISVSKAQLYLSDIQLVKSDGSFYSLEDTIVLKTFDTETYFVANVPAGQYKSIRFSVGLDPIENSKTPTTSSPSMLRDSSMWFTNIATQNNYVFVNFQGKIDTTVNANGTVPQMQPFSYKLGTNANYKQVSMPTKNYTVISNQVTYVHLLVNYSKLFNGVNLRDENNLSVNSISDNASGIATTIANNIPAMFDYEE